MKNTTPKPQLFRLNAAAVAVSLCFATPIVWAANNPTGATVVNGTASFATQGNTLSITNTPGTIINWQQFNIGKGYTTQFIQQSAQSSVLNRVLSNQPSEILGTLRSNGQVFLINQAGILFGAGSVVDVNGLMASTLNISNADFLLNRLNFNGSQGTSVLNQGSITTPSGGRVYLVGNNVTNEGVITTPQGNVVLAAGKSISLVDTNTPHVSVTIHAPVAGQVVNLGKINAQGGSIDVYAALIQQQGVLRADSASVDAQGHIVLSATQAVTLAQGSVTSANGVNGGQVVVKSGAAGSTVVAGKVSAAGTSGLGGNIRILGNHITLTDHAKVDASGDAGGGTVLIGGDFQGKNTAVQNATLTQIAQGATIKVDARVRGNGGKSVVWADDTTTFLGNISARGGAKGGNGGNVEVSGKRILAFKGGVNTLAPYGTGGTLLLDPTTLCVTDAAALAGCPSVISPTAIANNMLTNGLWEIVTSNGDLLVIDPILLSTAYGMNYGKTLHFMANNGNIITLNPADAKAFKLAGGTTTGLVFPILGGLIYSYGANVTFTATGSSANGTGEVHIGNSILTDGGNFTLNAQSAASVSGGGLFALPGTTVYNPAGIYTFGGAVNINATDFVLGWDQRTGMTLNTPVTINTLSGAVDLGAIFGGAVNIATAGGAPTTSGVLLETGSSIYTGSGKINLSGYRFGTPSGTTSGALMYSTGQALFNFDHIDTSKLSAHVGSAAFKPFTNTKSVFLGLANTDPRCQTDLCLFSSNLAQGNYYLWANRGIAIGSERNITVAGNVRLDGGNNQYAFVALNDIILNAVLTVTSPSVTMNNPVTGLPEPFPVTNLALIAGNNLINNVGAGALNLPVGHGWTLFAKDQTTSLLNGLSAQTMVNLRQDPLVFTPASILAILNQPGSTGANAANSTMSNPALVQLLAGLTATGGAISLGTKSGGNLALFWGASAPTPVQVAQAAAQTTALLDCNLNPALCGNTVANNVLNAAANPTPTTTSILKTTPAVGNVTYSTSLGVKSGLVWVAYDDIRRARHEARQADDDFERAEAHLNRASNPEERESFNREVEIRSAWVSVKRAESRVRETEMELRAAEAEMKAVKSPEERIRAEIRQTVAASRRADAEVKKANADARQAEVDVKNAKTPEAKAMAEVKKEEAETRKLQAEFKKAEVDVEKAETEVKQAEAEVAISATPQARAVVEVKRAEALGKKADVDIKRAEAEVKVAKDSATKINAEIKVAVAEAKKAQAEAQKANVEAKLADEEAKTANSPAAQRVAEVKKAEAEAKQADAEVKNAQVDVKNAKDPAERASAEEKVARAEVKKAEADVKVAEDKAERSKTDVAKAEVAVKKAAAEEKRAEVAVRTEKDSRQKGEAEVKLAEVKVAKVAAEEKQAAQEVKEARDSAKNTHAADDKYVALKKVEASEARVVAKNGEFAAKKAHAEVKRVESELKQVESDVKEAKSPTERANAERHLAEKRGEFESKRADAEQKGHRAETLRDEAEHKAGEYRIEQERQDEKALAAFGGVDIATMNPARVQELLSVRHTFLKGKLGSALHVLTTNPNAADLKGCGATSGGVCVRPLKAIADFAAEVVARIKLPFMSPTTSFLPEIERKVAVVIGNNAYQDPDIPALNGAVRDADAVSKMLKEKMGYDVRLIHNGTRADIVRTLNQVADETGSKDSVVVYYAGHGYQMEDTGMGYWIPSDGSTESPANWISNADINKMISSIPAKQMLIVSDSCFSGALTNEAKINSALTSKETPAEILGKRSVVVMSSGGEEPVMDEGRDGHSIFAWHLMDKLNKLGSYEHGAEVFDQIKAGVVRDGIPQVPQYGASVSAGHNAGGEYLFEVRKY